MVSAKGRKAQGAISGEGETQLEIERRLISEKETKIRKEIKTINENRQ